MCARLVQVLAVDQRDEFRIFEIVSPGEADEALQRGDGVILLDLELGFGLADPCIGVLQRDAEEFFLVAEVMVEHALVGLGAGGNVVDPRTAQPLAGEFGLGRGEDPCPRRVRIAGFDSLRPGHDSALEITNWLFISWGIARNKGLRRADV